MASDKSDSDSATNRAIVASPASSTESTSTELRQPQLSSRSAGIQLCGFLNKLSSTSIVKTYKRRWFVFNEGNCKLYYYRDPQDVQPLGEIDVKSASFYLDVTNWEKPGVFVIRTPQREYHLEAKDRQAGLYWLQELQRFRREHSLRRNLNLKQSRSVSDSCTPEQFTGGLLRKEPQRLGGEASGESRNEGLILSLVECPTAVVGEHTAQQQQSPSHSLSVLSNLRNPAALFQRRPRSQSADGKHYVLSVAESSGLLFSIGPCSELMFSVLLPSEHMSNMILTCELMSGEFLSDYPGLVMNSAGCVIGPEVEVRHTKVHQYKNPPEKAWKRLISNRSPSGGGSDAELTASNSARGKASLKRRHKAASALAHMVKSNTSHYSEVIELLLSQIYELSNKNNYSFSTQRCHRAQAKHCIVTKKNWGDIHLHPVTVGQISKPLACTRRYYERVVLNCCMFELITAFNTYLVRLFSPKDAVSAFHIQNKFLNKEILELNELRWNSEERERQLVIKCSNAEARHYQTQSKLLFLLKELNTPQEGDSNVQGIVAQLLEEAMHDPTLPKEIHETFLGSDEVYDTYGFNRKWGKECDVVVSKAENLKRKSENISLKMQDTSLISWRIKWENYLVNFPVGKALQKSPELKALVRTGVPHEFRSRVWRGCVELHAGQERAEKGPGYYEELLTSPTITSAFDPAVKQIELDLLRTLPNNRHYETPDAPGINPLRRVLLAYSRRNLIVGYCQGLNRLAAIALLFMSEEDAFWCLVTVVEYIMPRDYYSRTLEASQVDQRVLKDLMIEKLPRLYAHLESNKVDLSLFTFNWFLTVFVDTIPAETYLYIWDVFLYEGNKVLFRFALAIFKICEVEILNQEDYMAINRYLRTMPEKMTNIKQLSQVSRPFLAY
ncbi:unnamed protein product [Ixodes hexagonus]